MITTDVVTMVLSLLEGFALITSPCILPILPIILASSLTGSRKRPMGILLGFSLSFTLFALFSRNIVQYSGLNLNTIRELSYGLLFSLGLIMSSQVLSNAFARLTQDLAKINVLFIQIHIKTGEFFSGLMIGSIIALIWTPCAGPILATILVQIATQKTSFNSFLSLLCFSLGASLPMLFIALYSLKVTRVFEWFKQHALLLRKGLGFIIMLSVVFMIREDNKILTWAPTPTSIRTLKALEHGLWRPYKAPELAGIQDWINSPPLNLNDLKGKVVLIDFWTYSCINCMRTIPYLNDWYKKYQDKGLVIIGVHTPEFDFEKDLNNVKQAVRQDGIHYPVALDNQFMTWTNFDNHYWPAQYLIDPKGRVVYTHFGEGDDDIIENNIRFLLGMTNLTQSGPLIKPQPFYASFQETPETYLGYGRADHDNAPALIQDKVSEYAFPEKLADNSWALQGAWQVSEDRIISAKANAALNIHFKARQVFVVMGNATNNPIKVTLTLNGKPIDTSPIEVKQHQLYPVLELKQFDSGILALKASNPGLEIYTLTFGY